MLAGLRKSSASRVCNRQSPRRRERLLAAYGLADCGRYPGSPEYNTLPLALPRPVSNYAEQARIRIRQTRTDRLNLCGYWLPRLHKSQASLCTIIEPPSRLESDKLSRR